MTVNLISQDEYETKLAAGHLDFSDLYFDHIDIKSSPGADYSHSRFIDCIFNDADLQGADFSSATITGDMQNTSFKDALFYDAYLYGCGIKDCDFTKTSFEKAFFLHVAITNAKMHDTDFLLANLSSVYLRNIDASNVINLDIATISLGGATADEADRHRQLVLDALDPQPITMDRQHIHIEGHNGYWYPIDQSVIDGQKYFLLEHEEYGQNALAVIVDESGKLIMEDVSDGLEQLPDFLKLERYQAADDKLQQNAPASLKQQIQDILSTPNKSNAPDQPDRQLQKTSIRQ